MARGTWLVRTLLGGVLGAALVSAVACNDASCVPQGALLVRTLDGAGNLVDVDAVVVSVDDGEPYDCPRRSKGTYHCFSDQSGNHAVTVTAGDDEQTQSTDLVSDECGPVEPEQLDFVIGDATTPDGGAN